MKLIVLYQEYDREKSAKAFLAIRASLDRLNDIEKIYYIIDNKNEGEFFEELEKNIFRIGGDNSNREFSAWQKGIQFIKNKKVEYDLVLFTNEAIVNYDDSILDLPELREIIFKAMNHQSVVGRLDTKGFPLMVNGYDVTSWIRTSCFFVPKKVLDSFDTIISVDSKNIDNFIGKEYPEGKSGVDFFKKDANMSESYKTSMIKWLTEEWHSKFSISKESWGLFRTKVQAIVNEQLFSARVREKGFFVENFSENVGANNLTAKFILMYKKIKNFFRKGFLFLARKFEDKSSSGNDVFNRFATPGHFYSVLPDLEYVRKNGDKIYFEDKRKFLGIDLNDQKQLQYLDDFAVYYKDLPFEDEKKNNLRYFYNNSAFSYGDAIALYAMLRHLKPKNIIEIGSGYSSCVTLDTNELWFNNSINCTFIEPYPKLLLSLIKEEDRKRVKIFDGAVQDFNLGEYEKLKENDILFIDSSHVSKVGSDVNHLFFEVLPRLNTGVYVHIHDIHYPFEYKKEWLFEGRAWNEVFLLRAFLQFNNKFEIVFFNNYMSMFYKKELLEKMPLYAKGGGGSIWLKKIG